MNMMTNVGEKTARFLMSKPNSFFILPKKEDVPIRTCKKFGVNLIVTNMKDKPFKIVKRV